MEERRKMRRFDLQLPCLICVLDNCVEESVHRTETENISTGGAYLRAETPMPAGTHLNIELLVCRGAEAQKAQADSCVCLSGRVVRSDNSGMAVCFDGHYQIVGIAKLIQFSRAKAQWMETLAQGFFRPTATEHKRRRRMGPPVGIRLLSAT